MVESIIDAEVIAEYEKETGNQWREDIEERMAEICSFYGYGFAWNNQGNIVINNGFYEDQNQEHYRFYGKNIETDTEDGILRHYEYKSAKEMIDDWIEICKASNKDYEINRNEKPFKWIAS